MTLTISLQTLKTNSQAVHVLALLEAFRKSPENTIKDAEIILKAMKEVHQFNTKAIAKEMPKNA